LSLGSVWLFSAQLLFYQDVRQYLDSLVTSKFQAKNLHELTAEQNTDLWLTVQKVNSVLQETYESTAFTIEVKDGVNSQLFINVIPRKHGDLPVNDVIYRHLETPSEQLDNPEFHDLAQSLSLKLSND